MTILHRITFLLLPSIFLLSSNAAPPPELTILRQQYEKAYAERVTAVHEAGVEELNGRYSAGLDRATAEAKTMGNLENIIAIEAEKKRLIDNLAIPDVNGNTEPEILKNLRGIYRQQLDTLTAAKTENESALLSPYLAKLKELEAILVKNDRIDEAKELLSYRQGLALGAATPLVKTPPMSPASDQAPTAPDPAAGASPLNTNYPKGDDRRAAEWVLELGGTVTVLADGKKIAVKDLQSLPGGKFTVTVVTLKFAENRQATPPISDLLPLAGLENLEEFNISGLVSLTDDFLAVVVSMPKLKYIWLSDGNLTDACFIHLAKAPALKDFHFSRQNAITGEGLPSLAKLNTLQLLSIQESNSLTEAGFAALAGLTQIRVLQLDQTPIKDSDLPVFSSLENLFDFQVKITEVTLATLVQQKWIRGLKVLALSVNGGDLVSESVALAKACPDLDNFIISGVATSPLSSADLAALGVLSKLRRVKLYAPGINEEMLSGLAEVPQLKSLVLGYLKFSDTCLSPILAHKGLVNINFGDAQITDQGLLRLAEMKSLKLLNLSVCPLLTPAGIAVFRKERPDVTVLR